MKTAFLKPGRSLKNRDSQTPSHPPTIQRRTKKPFRTALISLSILLTLIALIVSVVVPWQIKKQLTSAIEQNCQTCSFKVQRVTFSPFHFAIGLHHVDFKQGDPRDTEFQSEIKTITATLSPSDLFSNHLKLKNIEIENPIVLVTEGDGKSKSSPSGPSKQTWTFASHQLNIHDGQFTYKRTRPNGVGILKVTDIQGSIGTAGSLPSMKELNTVGEATGILEGSGKFLLKIETPLFADTQKINVDLKIQNQNLAELNRYFKIDDGITFAGRLIDGHTSIKLEEERLTGWTRVRYDKLNIQFAKTAERSGLSAFFSNFVESVKVSPSNITARHTTQSGSVILRRKPNQTLIQFILAGMKDSAFKITVLKQPRT